MDFTQYYNTIIHAEFIIWFFGDFNIIRGTKYFMIFSIIKL